MRPILNIKTIRNLILLMVVFKIICEVFFYSGGFCEIDND